jgi:uncharacterized protein YuzE
MATKTLHTTTEAATLLAVHPVTIRRWIEAGHIKAVYTPVAVVVDPDANCAYIHFQAGSLYGPAPVARTVAASDVINLDYDADGFLVGIELLDAELLRPHDGGQP